MSEIIRILHLSDIHFDKSQEYDFEHQLVEPLIREVKKIIVKKR